MSQRRASEAEIITEHSAAIKPEMEVRETMVRMGLPPETIDASIASERHDHITTTYLLLCSRRLSHAKRRAGGSDGQQSTQYSMLGHDAMTPQQPAPLLLPAAALASDASTNAVFGVDLRDLRDGPARMAMEESRAAAAPAVALI